MQNAMHHEITSEELISGRTDFNLDANKRYSPIVYGVDGNYLMHAGVSMLSVIHGSSNPPLHFIIITSEENIEEFSKFFSLVENTIHAVSIVVISDACFTVFPATVTFPVSIYYRLLAPLIFKEYSFLLYLDADIVALQPIVDLLQHHQPQNAICAVVKEPMAQSVLSKAVNIPEGDYFNSGVLYINVQQWNALNISQKVFDCLLERGSTFLYFDQDALNIILHGHVLFLTDKFNQQIKTGHKKYDFERLPPEDTVLLHYVGSDKPWHIWNQQAIGETYRHYLNNSPWSNIIGEEPVKLSDIKKYYKSLRYQKKYFTSMGWFVKYQYIRCFGKKD